MGRSFEGVRMGIKDVSARWLKASKALKKENQIYGQKLAEMAKKHSNEAFYALDDPLEAAVFSVLVEMLKKQDEIENRIINSTKSSFAEGGSLRPPTPLRAGGSFVGRSIALLRPISFGIGLFSWIYLSRCT